MRNYILYQTLKRDLYIPQPKEFLKMKQTFAFVLSIISQIGKKYIGNNGETFM